MSDALRLTVAVPTYRRNDHLCEILPMLLGQLDDLDDRGVAEVLVIDNDADAGAQSVVRRCGHDRVRYVVEPRPGIAAARNKALDACTDRDVLVFIDDDERPAEHWLSRLLATYHHTGAAAVAGPVRSTYNSAVDPWIEAGGFFARRHRWNVDSGTDIVDAATNNLLLDLRVVRRIGLRFADEIGMAAAEDNLFTRGLTAAGERLVWCSDAWVSELVPDDRLTRQWVLTRQMSSGNGAARVALRMANGPMTALRVRGTFVVGAVVRVVGGTARCAFGWLTMSLTHRARGARTVSRGIGMLLGSLGYSYQAYRRPSSHVTEAGSR